MIAATGQKRIAQRSSFLLGLLVGALLASGAWYLGEKLLYGSRHEYVATRDLALMLSPDQRVGTVPRGSEIVTLLPLDTQVEDYGSDAWIRVRIYMSEARQSGIASYEQAGLERQGVPYLFLKGVDE